MKNTEYNEEQRINNNNKEKKKTTDSLGTFMSGRFIRIIQKKKAKAFL